MPEGWEWCNLGFLFNHNTGKALNSSNTGGIELTYITTSNVYWDRFELDELKSMGFNDNEIDKCTVTKGDLLVCEGGDIGRAAIWNLDEPIRIQHHLHRLRPNDKIVSRFYYYIFYLYKLNGKIKGNGIGLQGLSSNALHSIIVPIAPIKQQYMIVQKIEEIFDLIDFLDEQTMDLDDCIESIKSKILDLAIRGKLVSQNPDDEPASVLLERIRAEKEELIKAGKIKRDKKESVIFKGEDNSYYEKIEGEITNITEEIPFSIPENWCWCRLNTLCTKEIKRGKAPKYSDKSNTLVFAQKCNTKKGNINISLAQYLDENVLKKYQPEFFMKYNDIVINSTGTGTLGRVGIFEKSDDIYGLPIVPDSHITTIRVSELIVAKYIYALLKLKQPYFETVGEGSTNQKELRPEALSDILIPLPPVLEQKQIVATINSICIKLDKIEQSLN